MREEIAGTPSATDVMFDGLDSLGAVEVEALPAAGEGLDHSDGSVAEPTAVPEPAPVEPTPAPSVDPPVEPSVVDPIVDTPVVQPVEPGQEPAPAQTMEQKLQADNARLQGELNRMSAAHMNAAAAPPVQEEGPAHQYVNADDDLANILTSAEGINNLLGQVERQAMLRVPNIVTPLVEESARQAVSTMFFWKKNEDLLPHQEYVAGIVNVLQEANPTATFDQLTNTAVMYARQQLGIMGPHAAPAVVQPAPGQTPAAPVPRVAASVPPTSAPRPSAPLPLEGVVKELDELNILAQKQYG